MKLTPREIAIQAGTMSGEERAVYLDSVCESDPELKRRVLTLIEMQESQTIDLSHDEDADGVDIVLEPGAWFGGFKIEGMLGRGAMGTVYLAQQQNPKRSVALKVMNAEKLNATRLKRFELETESLAKLKHPGIATIYESGQTEVNGKFHPYFAMEYVQGRELDRYAASLDLRGRLELLSSICEAIEHAHLRGIVHRDLKPANIVVDQDGRARVLDFGVAKSLENDGKKVKELVGTIPYMSPEQLRRDADIDLRTDVFSLGVMIYEVLTGSLPNQLSGMTVDEAIQVVSTPPKLDTSGLEPEIRAIIGKAMHPDRELRYSAASQLAADLRCFLRREPVGAVDGGRWYRGKKFVARNRMPVGLAGLAVLLLIGGVIAASYQATRATRGWASAEKQRIAAEEATELAEIERSRAVAVNLFMVNMLTSADPEMSLGQEITVLELLDTAALTVGTELEEYPGVHATVRMALSRTYHALGDLEDALLHAREMVEVTTEHLGESDPITADAKSMLAMVLIELGSYDEAEILLNEAKPAIEAMGDPVEEAKLRNSIARIYHMRGRHDLSLAEWEVCEQILARELGANHKETLISMHNRGVALKDIGRLVESEEVMTEVVDRRLEAFGADHPQTLVAMDVLASVIQKQGRDEEAIEIFRDVVERRYRVLGPEHFSTLLSMGNLGAALIQIGQLDEAEGLTKQSLEGHRKRFGSEHTKTLVLMGNLAYLLEDQGKIEEAAAMYREVIDIREKASGGVDPETWSPINNLAMLLMNHDQLEESERLFEKLMAMCEAMLPANHYYLAIFRNNYGECLTKAGKFDEAERAFELSHPVILATFGPEHTRTIKSADRMEQLASSRTQEN
ncbi:MAG: serine/threonine protein kinase [Phycisphaerales bacterium]|nr:serine/threonine protein kinase [Phycisphaerales bacterium]